MKHRGARTMSEFNTVGEKQLGYSCAEVDDFFAALADDFELLRSGGSRQDVATSTLIRQRSFSGQAGGYVPQEVDAALDRVEDRFVVFEKERVIAREGLSAWNARLESDAELIMGRLNRPERQRFRRPSEKLTRGYFVGDVDALCESLKAHFLSDEELSPAMIREAVFSSATGEMSYEETQVDAFLDRCVSLILAIKA